MTDARGYLTLGFANSMAYIIEIKVTTAFAVIVMDDYDF